MHCGSKMGMGLAIEETGKLPRLVTTAVLRNVVPHDCVGEMQLLHVHNDRGRR